MSEIIHRLKILPCHFEQVIRGNKTFEIRDNTDRGFQKGDLVALEEFDNKDKHSLSGRYTGRKVQVKITYVTAFEMQTNWVVFSFKITSSPYSQQTC